ncbi:MAG: tRNA guanosine(34) transglycosylase Tgt [candidate division Zixibacteria bacterium]|nr:tRNA guanosine(34) transglycosylase Tgt [candidate division Zixibacteria bacterium]
MKTTHGDFQTPAFAPVATAGSVKTLLFEEVRSLGTEIVLSNSYHLYLKPGVEVIREAGGLHRFINWEGPILTDSGGFQAYRLSEFFDYQEEGVAFRSHWDGSQHFFSPEKVLEIQQGLGSDLIMPLDFCPPYPAEEALIARSVRVTTEWAKRSKSWWKSRGRVSPLGQRQYLFGIVQGSTSLVWRKRSAQELSELEFDGYALGGLSLGETKGETFETVGTSLEHLPPDRLRYLMGMGTPEDLLLGIEAGIDLFDCALPTRNARNGTVYSWEGKLVLKGAGFKDDFQPIDERCGCPACRNYSRAYIRHLFNVREITAMHLASLHNLWFYQELLRVIREKIKTNEFAAFKKSFTERYREEEVC